jgi:hypothetical protein
LLISAIIHKKERDLKLYENLLPTVNKQSSKLHSLYRRMRLPHGETLVSQEGDSPLGGQDGQNHRKGGLEGVSEKKYGFKCGVRNDGVLRGATQGCRHYDSAEKIGDFGQEFEQVNPEKKH